MNITPNLQIRPEDIRNNPELWIQKISVIIFTDENGKPWWTKEYKFLPNHARYNQAVKWIRDTKFEEYNCRIVQNANNEIEIITRNYFGKKASLEQEEKEILRKVKRKLGEVIRKDDQELIEQLDYEADIEFAEEIIETPQDWTTLGFTPQQKQDWINIGLAEEDGEFAKWLSKIKKLSPEQVLNHGNEKELREEYEKTPKQTKEPILSAEQKKMLEEYRKSLKDLGKSKNVEEFLESEFREIYEEEAEELERLAGEKEQEGESGVSYDLGRPDLAILWRKQLYFVSGFEYVNNWKLTVSIRARKRLLGMYYWNWMRGGGVGFLEKGAVIEDKGQRMHYEFCDELGIKKVYQQAFSSYQPEFSLFKSINRGLTGTDGNSGITWSQQSGEKAKNLRIPTDIVLEIANEQNINEILKRDTNGLLSAFSPKNIFTGNIISKLTNHLTAMKSFLTIGPKELNSNEGSLWNKFFQKEEILDFKKNPKLLEWLKKQPHLREHVTVQFYLFNNIVMPANWMFLGIEEKNGHFVLPYKLFINFSPGNLYYRWEFNHISVKCEISTEGVFQDFNNPLRYLTHINIEAATFGGGINWNPDAADLPTQHIQEIRPSQEAQTDRVFKSTRGHPFDKTVEPSMFNANTIDFHYSLGEFFNRLTDPIMFYRIHVSELLYNRLKWANNKQKILNLPVKWESYGTFAQKLGEWKWGDVKLESDIQGFFKERMEQGYILSDGSKSENPNFDYASH